MQTLLSDLRFSLRQLRNSPGFAIVAVLMLALGIGANTAVFSALNALLLKMLPVRDPQNLYAVLLMNGGTQPPNTAGTGNGNTVFSYPVYQALRQQSKVFTNLIAHIPLAYEKVPVRYGATPTEKAGEEVSGDYFSGLGVPMLRGTGFTQSDENSHAPIVVLSYGFWTEAFSQDPSVIGRTLFIKGLPFTITGVTVPTFYGVQPGSAVDFWIPLQNRPELNAWGEAPNNHKYLGSPIWWDVPLLARLKAGVNPEQAQQALQAVFWQAASEGVGTLDPKTWPAHLGFEAIRGIANYSESYRTPVEIMMTLVGLVLLIACTNVALLTLARNATRQREFAVRIAVGARSSRLVRQLLAESLLLVSAGAALGWMLAVGATRALAVWARIDTGLAPDRRVLLFTLCVASLAAIAFGLVPLRATLTIAVEQELKGNSTRMSADPHRVRNSNIAIAMQIAMCVTLLVASGLSLRSLLNYQRQDLGMQAERLLVFDLDPQAFTDKSQAFLFYQRVLDQIKRIPGVEAASLVRTRPGSGWGSTSGLTIDGVDMRQDSGPHVSSYYNSVGPEYFHTMGIPIVLGRDITQADLPGSPLTAVVNENFARRFLKDGALGHKLNGLPGAEIVGVVKDSKFSRVREENLPAVYYPLSQTGMSGQLTVEVRSLGDPMALLPALQRVIHDLDPNLPLQKPMTQAVQFEESYVTPRLFARLAMGFGVLAVFLVATGLYGTLAYRVQRRRSEIGIRMALGAPQANVVWMIFRESLLMASLGFVIGLPMAFAVSRWLRSQLYQLSYFDLTSFSTAVAITLLVVMAAAFLPARRASRVDPMVALRSE